MYVGRQTLQLYVSNDYRETLSITLDRRRTKIFLEQVRKIELTELVIHRTRYVYYFEFKVWLFGRESNFSSGKENIPLLNNKGARFKNIWNHIHTRKSPVYCSVPPARPLVVIILFWRADVVRQLFRWRFVLSCNCKPFAVHVRLI